MGILHIIVDPNAVDQIQRIRIILVVFVKRVIKYILLNGIDPDGIGAHFLDVTEPPQVGFLIDAKFCGPFARHTGAHIDAPDFKRFIAAAAVKVYPVAFGFYKGGNGLLRMEINIPAQAVIGGIQYEKCHSDRQHYGNKFFHASPSSLSP